ncbi:putative ribonuclease H protein [Glycine soja]
MGEAVWENIHVIKALLRGYELASGLKINFAKSRFGIIGGGVNWSLEAANILHCRQLEYPFLYLGLPIGANPSSQLVDKRGFSHWWRDIRNLYPQSDCGIFKDNLAWKVGSGENIKFWTDNWLGEQHTLQQKYNQLFLISRQQKDHISQMGHFNHNNWRWDMRWRKIPWVKWEAICLPKEEGGLGIKEISKFNEALLGKWRQHQRCFVLSFHSVPLRDLKIIFQNAQQGEKIKKGISWKVGRGDRFKFWEDEWIQGEVSLITKYPRLFVISQQQNNSIQQMGGFKDNEWEWNLSWRRPLFDNEQQQNNSILV